MRVRARVVAVVALLSLAACGGDPASLPNAGQHGHTSAGSSSTASTASAASSGVPTVKAKPVALRRGERFLELRMPHPYTPSVPTIGTDEYRCFLLDPKLSTDAVITGTDFLPGNVKEVHHVILYKVDPQDVAAAKALDAKDSGDGWTCFGGTGIREGGAGAQQIDQAPWLGAWAPGGTEKVTPPGIGTSLPEGSQIVMQIHYNLLDGSSPDQSAAKLRIATDDGSYNYLHTTLLPAPIELPCRDGVANKLCSRDAAMADNYARFGTEAKLADLLHLLCGPEPVGPTQSCTRPVAEPMVVRAIAGHMHLLGRSISVVADKGTPNEKTLLDIATWDFDNQGSIPLPQPVRLTPTDTLTVTCTHDQSLRDKLPAFAGTKERYVVWGEGTTDEMCLGIVLFTKS